MSKFLIGFFRLSVNGGSEKHSLRKDTSGGYSRSRFSKSPEQIEAAFSMTTIEEEQENPLNGKWLVTKIKHIINDNSTHRMALTCVRDSNHIPPITTGINIP